MLQYPSTLQQYPITDLHQWFKEKTLVLNPDFQRRDNWTPSARSYLIDTILRGLPIPNIYMRMQTNAATQKSYREVVDGQQRLRTIFGFISGSFALAKNAKEYAGQRYEDLDVDDQLRILGYQLGVVQLYGASNDVVLDVFHRLNAYGLSVNGQERRHGKCQGGKYKGEFRRVVIEASERWVVLWEQFNILSVRARVRMADHELMAQMLGVLLEGVVDGGQPSITRLYEQYDEEVPELAIGQLDRSIEYIIENLSELLYTRLAASPHFLMLFAAVSHALYGIPKGQMGSPHPEMPDRDPDALADLVVAITNLWALADVLDAAEEDVSRRFREFRLASSKSTQRIRSRSQRFPTIYRAFLPREI